MKVAYQTWILVVLTAAQFAISQVQGNSDQFPMPAWLAVVVLPTLAMLITLAANQLKAVGSPPPDKTTVTAPNVTVAVSPPLTETNIKPPQ